MAKNPVPIETPVEDALAEWRRKAVNVFSVASAVAYLPATALMVEGAAPPNGWPAQVMVTGAYLSCLFCAILYRSDYRVRAWTLLVAIYVVALVHLITIPRGPFGQALSALLPILAIVVLGARAAWATTAASIGLILVAPLLQQVTPVVELLTREPAATPTPTNVVMYQGVALVALLVGQMTLLDRFHDFLMRSLAGLQHETNERTAAYSTLEREMRERRQLEHDVARTGDEERRRLGVDIHDGVCQQLTAALLHCEAITRCVERGEPVTASEFAALAALLEDAIDESHAVAKGLCPLEPHPGALATALQMLSKRTRISTGLPCSFTATGDVSVSDPTTAQHLYRIAQEAVSNATRHANATEFSIKLEGNDDGLTLAVEDNGKGISTGARTEGMGLRTMAYRAHLLAGELDITPGSTGGTRVFCRVPNEVDRANQRTDMMG